MLQDGLAHTAAQKQADLGLLLQLGADCAPNKAVTTADQIGGSANFQCGSAHHKNTHTPYEGENTQHTRKETTGTHTKCSPGTKSIKTHSDYTRMLLHKNNSSRPQEITVSPKSRGKEIKLKPRSRGTISKNRTGEISNKTECSKRF